MYLDNRMKNQFLSTQQLNIGLVQVDLLKRHENILGEIKEEINRYIRYGSYSGPWENEILLRILSKVIHI